jgi:acyl-CoA thioester hydrolase
VPRRLQNIPAPATIRVEVRADDVDVNGHVRGGAYLAYADHARWALVQASGVDLDGLKAAGLGPVNLETTVRFQHELRVGDELEIHTTFSYGNGKTSRVHQELRRTSDGELCAEVTSVSGMLDLDTRRLIHDPRSAWEPFVQRPEPLGLA